MKLNAVVLAFVAGAVAGGAFAGWSARREVTDLQARSDSVTAAAVSRDSASAEKAAADSATIAALQASKKPATVTIRADSAAQDSLERAMAGLKTGADTIKNQARQIVALKSEVDSLKSNARTDSLSLWTAMRRGDALRDSLHAQTVTIVGLNERIQALSGRTFPKWARISFAIVEKGLAAKGLADVIRGK